MTHAALTRDRKTLAAFLKYARRRQVTADKARQRDMWRNLGNAAASGAREVQEVVEDAERAATISATQYRAKATA